MAALSRTLTDLFGPHGPASDAFGAIGQALPPRLQAFLLLVALLSGWLFLTVTIPWLGLVVLLAFLLATVPAKPKGRCLHCGTMVRSSTR